MTLAVLPLLSVLAASGAEVAPAPMARTKDAPEAARSERVLELKLPSEKLLDQDGRTVTLPELTRGRFAVVNFVFSTCSTICSPMSAVFARLRSDLGDSVGSEVALVSITLDPARDTPEKLNRFGAMFIRGPGWTFVTGEAPKVTRVLKALGGWVPDKTTHTPMTLVGNPATGQWIRVWGMPTPQRLKVALQEVGFGSEGASKKRAPAMKVMPLKFESDDPDEAARRYFTDTEVVDQHGKRHRFYSDLVKGKRVLINFAFASCKTACSPITANLARVQRELGARVGQDVRMLTITVDPVNDTPQHLQRFATKFQAGPGWFFLSGSPANVHAILKKLGGYTENPEQHSTTLLIGDAATGVWTKGVAMDDPASIADVVRRLDEPQAR